jgi:hypothetical protein
MGSFMESGVTTIIVIGVASCRGYKLLLFKMVKTHLLFTWLQDGWYFIFIAEVW